MIQGFQIQVKVTEGKEMMQIPLNDLNPLSMLALINFVQMFL